jgi:hypothetical protein
MSKLILILISETWVLKKNVRNKLMIFGRKIMRKIYGPTRTDDGYWRIQTNQEINDIVMWSIPLCYCNNGNNNRIVSQTQLQYYINYTMGGGYMFRPLRDHLQAIR